MRESARSGALPYVRLGRYVRFDPADVEAWVEARKRPGRRHKRRAKACKASRGGRTRTCNPRFWRPVLCQLSYAPELRRRV